MRYRLSTILGAIGLIIVALGLTVAVPSIAEKATAHWGDLRTAGFFLAFIVVWPAGTVIFTPRRRRT